MYKGSFVFALVTKTSMTGHLYFLEMVSDTQIRRYHSVECIWSGRLSWSARPFFPQDVLCGDQDRELLCLSKNFLCQIAYHLRNRIICFFVYATTHHHGIVQDHRFSHDPVPEGIQSQLNCLQLQDVDMEIEFHLCPYPCCNQVLQMHIPTSF